MAKRILFTFMVLLAIYSSIIIVYEMNRPDTENTGSADKVYVIDYESLTDYTLNSGASATHYYLFYSSHNNDCLYVADTVLRDAQAVSGVDLDNLIEFVDITELEDKLETYRLKEEWGITSYPALIACKNKFGAVHIENRLEWNSESPMNATDVIQWLMLNGLYDGSNGELISTPKP
ncbi:MAG: hypothetical protein K6D03_02385 [Solobacterium sp.]|nr:hypothetical protein [Solobacterium sp.]